MEQRIEKHLDTLMERYPRLSVCRSDIERAYQILEECYESDHKLLIIGNGGSTADLEHIAGELMKRFKTPRPCPPEFSQKLKEIDPVRGENLSKNLERGLMAIPLVAHEAFTTAYINDVDGVSVCLPSSCMASVALVMCSSGYRRVVTVKRDLFSESFRLPLNYSRVNPELRGRSTPT